MNQVQNIADILHEHQLLDGVPSKEICMYDVEEDTFLPMQQAKTKGNNNLLHVNELVFLNVILARERFYAENRGIRKQLNTNDISIYSIQKEAISGSTHFLFFYFF